MKHIKYQSLKRFGHKEVREISDGKCRIYPKIDGANATINLDENGEIQLSSRNRIIGTEESFGGFREWAIENHDNLMCFFKVYPEARINGEWLKKHHVDYQEDAYFKFYAFDISYAVTLDASEIGIKQDLRYTDFEDYRGRLEDCGIPTVPLLDTVVSLTEEDLVKYKGHRFLLADGAIGEGLVVKRHDFVNRYGRTNWAKYVFEEYKEKAGSGHKKKNSSNGQVEPIESKIVSKFLKQPLADKEYSKLVFANDGEWEKKLIRTLINNVYDSIIMDDMLTIIEQFSSPTINFGKLKGLVAKRLKELLPKAF